MGSGLYKVTSWWTLVIHLSRCLRRRRSLPGTGERSGLGGTLSEKGEAQTPPGEPRAASRGAGPLLEE